MPYDRAVKATKILTATAATATATSDPQPLPRVPYAVSVTQYTTGTSIAGATVVWSVSNDVNALWVPLGSASCTTTNAAGAGTSTANQAVIPVNTATACYAYGRAVVTSTGTGSKLDAWIAS
jgi:hypothetical protein